MDISRSHRALALVSVDSKFNMCAVTRQYMSMQSCKPCRCYTYQSKQRQKSGCQQCGAHGVDGLAVHVAAGGRLDSSRGPGARLSLLAVVDERTRAWEHRSRTVIALWRTSRQTRSCRTKTSTGLCPRSCLPYLLVPPGAGGQLERQHLQQRQRQM